MKKEWIRRILAAMLAAVIGVSLIPVPAFADDTPESPLLERLDSIHLLAFSQIVYLNWRQGQSVYGRTKASWEKPVFRGDPEITYRRLCGALADWKVVKTSGPESETGFYAVTFQGETAEGIQTVISFRGSNGFEKWSISDISRDWFGNCVPFQLLHEYSDQMYDAENYYLECIRDPRIAGTNVIVTGHSLGGALAELVSMLYGVRAEVFNTASSYAALHRNRIVGSFPGVDRWNVLAHGVDWDVVSAYNDDFKKTPYRVYAYAGAEIPHVLVSFLQYDPASDRLVFSDLLEASDHPSAVISQTTPLYLGTSGNDRFLASSGLDRKLYGGDGDDCLISPGVSDDDLIGGNSVSEDVLDGGRGNDRYYWYRGNGVQRIYDIGGEDVLFLNGISGEVLECRETEDFWCICAEGEPIVWLSRSRSGAEPLRVVAQEKEVFRLEGSWRRIGKSADIIGAVDVEILNSSGETVQVLRAGEEKVLHQRYVSAYCFRNPAGQNEVYLDLAEGYDFRFRGSGALSLSYSEQEGRMYCIANVLLAPDSEAFVSGGEIPQLAVDTDGSGEADLRLNLSEDLLRIR